MIRSQIQEPADVFSTSPQDMYEVFDCEAASKDGNRELDLMDGLAALSPIQFDHPLHRDVLVRKTTGGARSNVSLALVSLLVNHIHTIQLCSIKLVVMV